MEKKILSFFVMMLFLATTTYTSIGHTNNNIGSSFAEVLDQSQTWEDVCQFIPDSEWQEFKPTIDNLNRVEVKVAQWFGGSPDMELTVEKPLGNVLTSRKVAAINIPSGSCGWVSFNVPDITLIIGASYYIRVIAPLGSEYGWGLASNNLYSQGISSKDPADWCFKTYGNYDPTIPGLTFSIVEFMLPEQPPAAGTGWGLLEVDIDELTSHFQLKEGYLNVYTNDGWVIPNMYINQVDGMERLSTYFRYHSSPNSGPEMAPKISAYIDFDDGPKESFQDGDRVDYQLDEVLYYAEGFSLEPRLQLSNPPPVFEFFPFIDTWDFTKPLRKGENIQAAKNQCAPMGVANSLQYLENSYSTITIPHNHVKGQDGDSSLVGQLDEAMGRYVVSRTNGDGCDVPMIFDGKFKYLQDNGIEDTMCHKFQGNQHFGATPGDYSAYGSTAKDESVNNKVTFNWIKEQLEMCEDVEVGIKWGGGGGHMVRIYGCGKTLGKPYLRYAHDRTQAHPGPGGTIAGDNVGLETAQVYVEDLDGDGMMNWGSIDDEIVFAIAESPIRLIIKDIWSQIGIYALLKNEADEDVTVNWEINIDAMFMFMGRTTSDTDEIASGEELTIKTGMIFGFGPATITVTVNDLKETYECFLLGPLALGIK